MQNQYLFLGWALVSWIIYRFVQSIVRDRQIAAESLRRGCKAPPRYKNRLPWGLDTVYDSLTADKKKKFPELMIKRYARMGNRTFESRILGNRNYSTNDPKNVQALLATQFKDFGLGERRSGLFRPLLGTGIFTADGKVWEHSRAMMRPQFNRDQISDLRLEEVHVQNLMRALQINQSKWTSQVDLQVLFFRLTIDSACEFLFGESIDSQILNLPENAGLLSSKAKDRAIDEVKFATAFDRSQAWCSHRTRFMDKYWLVDGLAARRDCKTVHDFVDYFVRRALKQNPNEVEKELEKGSANHKDKYVFLDALARETRDPIELRDQLLNILLAGRDTTASLLGWTFWILARHPDIFDKLRASIVEQFGTYSSSSANDISFVSLKNCQYLQHVINESLRLYPVVPVNMRQALRDTTLPRGGGEDGSSPIFVPKGRIVDYSVHVMHRLKELWGEDADEFKPERWQGRRPGWEYLPFNGGPRICLGRKSTIFFFFSPCFSLFRFYILFFYIC
jgi:cytochrome P450